MINLEYYALRHLLQIMLLSEDTLGERGILNKVTMDGNCANIAGIDTINLQLALLFMMGGLFLQIYAS
jgi:hypothetical protein